MNNIIYLIGSLRNKRVPIIANKLRELGYEVFEDWYSAGERADDCWKEYEQGRGHTYIEALHGLAADHIFRFDLLHLNRADTAVLLLPAGKSGHLEFGYMIGQGKRGYILLDSVDRWDVMYKFATGIFADLDSLIVFFKNGS